MPFVQPVHGVLEPDRLHVGAIGRRRSNAEIERRQPRAHACGCFSDQPGGVLGGATLLIERPVLLLPKIYL